MYNVKRTLCGPPNVYTNIHIIHYTLYTSEYGLYYYCASVTLYLHYSAAADIPQCIH